MDVRFDANRTSKRSRAFYRWASIMLPPLKTKPLGNRIIVINALSRMRERAERA